MLRRIHLRKLFDKQSLRDEKRATDGFGFADIPEGVTPGQQRITTGLRDRNILESLLIQLGQQLLIDPLFKGVEG